MKNLKKNGKKGFTLAELLIVVAIIAVLVAIAIPVFNSQLEKSRRATAAANLRAAYAEASAAYLGQSTSSRATYTKTTTGGTVAVTEVELPTDLKTSDDEAKNLSFTMSANFDKSTTDGGSTITFTFTDSDGTVTAAQTTK